MGLDIVRATPGGFELRTGGTGSAPVLTGHFAVFDSWTRIASAVEGTFMERVAPGAFARTFAQDRASIKVMFNHGKDPQVGEKLLGRIDVLREDPRGAYYEVALLEGLDPLVLAGLRAGLYGASFRFTVEAEDFDPRPRRSITNPDGIAERTIRSARVSEFGPVSWPAYPAATAGIRSLTDLFINGAVAGS
jgi:hypothetical protein